MKLKQARKEPTNKEKQKNHVYMSVVIQNGERPANTDG